MDEELTFEDAYQALQDTVERLQNGGLTIAESVTLYERGMKLADLCSRRLQEAELRVSQLAQDADGTLIVAPLGSE